MLIFLAVLSFISLFILTVILALSFNKEVFKSRLYRNEKIYSHSNNKYIEFINSNISKSNIRSYISFYNWYLHLILSVICCIIFYKSDFIDSTRFVKISFSLIGLLAPFMALNIMSYLVENKIKKQSISFLTGLNNFYQTYNDIFMSFEQLIDITNEPLRGYIKGVVGRNKMKVDPITNLNEFKMNVGKDTELGLFVDNLKISILEGTNTKLLIEEFLKDIELLLDADEKYKADEIMSYSASYIFVIVVIIGIKSAYTIFEPSIIETWWHQLATALALLWSTIIVVNSLRR